MLNVVALSSLLLHAVILVRIGTAMVIRFAAAVPARAVLARHYAAWLVVSVIVAWMIAVATPCRMPGRADIGGAFPVAPAVQRRGHAWLPSLLLFGLAFPLGCRRARPRGFGDGAARSPSLLCWSEVSLFHAAHRFRFVLDHGAATLEPVRPVIAPVVIRHGRVGLGDGRLDVAHYVKSLAGRFGRRHGTDLYHHNSFCQAL